MKLCLSFPLFFFSNKLAKGMLVASLCIASFSPTMAQEVTSNREVVLVTSRAASTLQRQWIGSTIPQRVKLAEQLGEAGGRQFATARGWAFLSDGTIRQIPQGPDMVCRGSDGIVHVIECKGGTSPLGKGYGFVQGSSEWAIESAKRVLRSPAASQMERAGAEATLKAAKVGKMHVHVIRTPHVLGQPTKTVLEQTVKCSNQATKISAGYLKSSTGKLACVSDDVARQTKLGGRLLSKVAVPVALAADGAMRVSKGMAVEQQFDAGNISLKQREKEHAKNAAGMAGGWGGAFAGAQIGATGGGIAGSVAPGPGTAIGGTLGGIAGGVTGYFAGEAAAQSAADWTMDKIHASGNTISESTSSAWQSTKNAASSVKRRAIGSWNWVRGY